MGSAIPSIIIDSTGIAIIGRIERQPCRASPTSSCSSSSWWWRRRPQPPRPPRSIRTSYGWSRWTWRLVRTPRRSRGYPAGPTYTENFLGPPSRQWNGLPLPLSRYCRDKPPYANSSRYIQHLNQQHSAEEAQSLRISTQLPDIIKCRICGRFCMNNTGLKLHQSSKHKASVAPSTVDQLPPTDPTPSIPPELAPPDLLEAVSSLSAEQLLDVFQRPLYDIHRT